MARFFIRNRNSCEVLIIHYCLGYIFLWKPNSKSFTKNLYNVFPSETVSNSS